MKFTQENLQKAADIGSQRVSEAFSRLSSSDAKVEVSKVETVPLKTALKRVTPPEQYAVAVYSQLLSGVPGASVMVLPREDALALVDLLNKQKIGTTGILKEYDISAIKETLNILSNSYITALSQNAGIEIGVDVPNMISAVRFSELINNIVNKGADKDDTAIVFETQLTITQHKITADLYVLFNKKMVELIKQ